MNTKTKKELVEFIEQVERMAQGVVHMIGTAQASDVIAAGETLKMALEHDETILEVS